MNWIISLVIGGLIGWLASIVMRTNARMGCIANVIVGVLGSALGYWLAGVIGLAPRGELARYALAVGGAMLLIFILLKLGVFKRA